MNFKLYLLLEWDMDENKQKQARIVPYFLNVIIRDVISCGSVWIAIVSDNKVISSFISNNYQWGHDSALAVSVLALYSNDQSLNPA